MPCLLGCLALFMPRLVIVLLVIFSDYVEDAYETWIWPVLGFFFLPLTTLTYAFAWHLEPRGSVQGIGLVLVIVAVLVDLGLIGGSASNKRLRKMKRTA